jgi:hypothetical protein
MDQIIGRCKQCGAAVWAQVDGVPPVPITFGCTCGEREIEPAEGIDLARLTQRYGVGVSMEATKTC